MNPPPPLSPHGKKGTGRGNVGLPPSPFPPLPRVGRGVFLKEDVVRRLLLVFCLLFPILNLLLLPASVVFASSTPDEPSFTSSPEPSPDRRQALVHLVRQDCGACHGLKLTGGLGPALTPDRLQKWSPELLAAAIVAGRPGTPMPPWRQFLTDAEAVWIARQLQQGFPE